MNTPEINLKSLIRTAVNHINTLWYEDGETIEFEIKINNVSFTMSACVTWSTYTDHYDDLRGGIISVEKARMESIDELLLHTEEADIDLTDFLKYV